jgi:hypothetical protein
VLVVAPACDPKQETATDCLGRSVPTASMTGTAQLTWQAPQTRTDGSPLINLSAYRIHYGVEPDQLRCRILVEDPKATTWKVTALPPGKWYFAVVSVDGAGVESELSGIVSKRID